MVGSFGLLVVLGTLGLKWLPGLYTGAPLGWVDAAFTATSAVCVTGLIVVDTATYFTFAGQLFLLLLIQLGGLGMITFTTLIIVNLGKRLSLRHETMAGGAGDVAFQVDSARLTIDVVRFTFAIELAGALLLAFAFVPRFGVVTGAWHALFHSVSAFCNAGFSTFTDSLIGVRESPIALGTIMLLIVSGGLGFLTLEELAVRRRARRRGARPERLSLHARLVLAVTAVLLVGGFVVLTALEWRNTLAGMPVTARLLNGAFLSVTPRTAGFNAVDYATARDATNFFTILLMFVGGSPGSTAGGIKTTTAALVALLAWSRFRGSKITSVAGRTVPEETIQRAIGVSAVAFGMLTAAVLVLVWMTPSGGDRGGASFLAFMFEAASALNTVGLSMGVTADLSTGGRWLTILLMYIGRVGPLAFAASIALPVRPAVRQLRFAYEDVVVG
jgi:trk system potassium uptake protein TrkH